jgi:hypothetical protein
LKSNCKTLSLYFFWASCDRPVILLSQISAPNFDNFRKMMDNEDEDLSAMTDGEHDRRLEEALRKFWVTQQQEMAVLEIGTEQDFKNHNDLPLARIKRIMKSDEGKKWNTVYAPLHTF